MVDLARKTEKEKTIAEITPSFETKYQRKQLATSITATGYMDVTASDFKFSGLTVGKTYKITGSWRVTDNGSAGQAVALVADIENSATVLQSIIADFEAPTDGNGGWHTAFSRIFVATGSELRFNVTTAVVARVISGNTSWTELEELPNHVSTTDFT